MQVGANDCVPERVVGVQSISACDPRTIHQCIDPNKARKHAADAVGIGDVAGGEAMRTSHSVASEDQNVPALSRQSVSDGAADPAGAAGNDRLFHCAVPPPSTGRILPVVKEAPWEVREAWEA